MIIDVNGYYGTWPYWPLRHGDAPSLLAWMDRCGIDRVFLGSLRAVFSDPHAGNREILELVQAHPDRLAPALTYSPYAAHKECYRSDWEEGRTGIVKLFPLQHTYNPLEESFIHELMSFCGERGLPVMIPYRLMMSWRFPTLDLQKIALLAARYPQTVFIIGSINYLAELQTTLSIMQQHANVYLETSGMMAFHEIERVVEQIGSDRLLHGSCIPLQNPAIGPLKIQKANLSVSDKERILGLNVQHLFQRFQKSRQV